MISGILLRTQRIPGHQIMGQLHMYRVKAGQMLPTFELFQSLERDWRDNQRAISAIPEGTYHCKRTWSPRFKQDLYILESVPNRSGIRIHVANFYTQLNGCIALGLDWGQINSDNIPDLIMSRAAMDRFHSFTNSENFNLKIIDLWRHNSKK
jgi:hypothetical protein